MYYYVRPSPDPPPLPPPLPPIALPLPVNLDLDPIRWVTLIMITPAYLRVIHFIHTKFHCQVHEQSSVFHLRKKNRCEIDLICHCVTEGGGGGIRSLISENIPLSN